MDGTLSGTASVVGTQPGPNALVSIANGQATLFAALWLRDSSEATTLTPEASTAIQLSEARPILFARQPIAPGKFQAACETILKFSRCSAERDFAARRLQTMGAAPTNVEATL